MSMEPVGTGKIIIDRVLRAIFLQPALFLDSERFQKVADDFKVSETAKVRGHCTNRFLVMFAGNSADCLKLVQVKFSEYFKTGGNCKNAICRSVSMRDSGGSYRRPIHDE